MASLGLIAVLVIQGFTHMGAGRDFWFIDPTKSGDDTKRRSLFAAISSLVVLAIVIGSAGFSLNVLWALAGFPFWFAFSLLPNDATFSAGHGDGENQVKELNDGNQYLPAALRFIWPDEKINLNNVWQVKLRGTLYEAISCLTLAPVIAGAAYLAGNNGGMIFAALFPLVACSYFVVGLFGWTTRSTAHSEFIAGCTAIYLIWCAANYSLF